MRQSIHYPHILGKVLKDFWALTEEKHFAILSALEARLAGDVGHVFMDDGGAQPDPDEYCDGTYFESNGTAVIPVYGILGKHLSGMEMDCGGCSLDRLASMVDVAAQSSRIKRILLNISSPGGTVTGTPEMADVIAEACDQKEVWAFTDSDCCSGALWLASQAQKFYCTKSSNIGSVGVRMVLLDFSEAYKKEGVKVNPIFSGKYKLSGASFKPLEDDEREMFQAESDRIHAEFKSAVISVRPVAEEFLQGQVFRGEMAAQIGMVDGLVSDLDEVLDMPLEQN